MSGIIPPSIVTYDTPIDFGPRFVTVAFPFRVRIEKIWFTVDGNILGDIWNLTGDRTLKLAAFKVKNTKTQHETLDDPTDMANFFGSTTEKPYIMEPDESLKPTLWLGNPDSRPEGQVVQLGGGITNYVFRSTAKSAAELNDPANVGWGNPDWTEEEFNLYTYKTDLAVMNTDEVLCLFIYNSSGDWDSYTSGSAVATIYVSYTGASFPDVASAPNPTWTPWIED